MKGDSVHRIATIEDSNVDESLYTCSWVLDTAAGEAHLAIGGKCGIVKIIHPRYQEAVVQPTKCLKGHGSEIFDIKTHPTTPIIIASASRDYSVRLWNIMCESNPLIAILGGEQGHREPVLGLDFHPCLPTLLSSGMDHAIKLWALPDDVDYIPYDGEIVRPIKEHLDDIIEKQASRKVTTQHFPLFSTHQIHSNYVDSVAWWTGPINEDNIPDLHSPLAGIKRPLKRKRKGHVVEEHVSNAKTSANKLIRSSDLILSKSALEGHVKVWRVTTEEETPDKSRGFYDLGITNITSKSINFPTRLSAYAVEIVAEIPLPDCELWYIRFGLLPLKSHLALGNERGKVFIWDLKDLCLTPQNTSSSDESGDEYLEPSIYELKKTFVTLDLPPLAGAKDTPSAGLVAKADLEALDSGAKVPSHNPKEARGAVVVRYLAWSPTGDAVVAVGDKGVVSLWRATTTTTTTTTTARHVAKKSGVQM